MHFPKLLQGSTNNAGLTAALLAAILNLINASSLNAQQTKKTASPIQHVIVIIGENRTFDHIFATYQPPKGQTVWNLLSQGIVNIDGTPGPNFSRASQSKASDTDKYQVSPGGKSPYQFLPPEKHRQLRFCSKRHFTPAIRDDCSGCRGRAFRSIAVRCSKANHWS
jgi:hypothetical protein